jgi:hypothetical protein
VRPCCAVVLSVLIAASFAPACSRGSSATEDRASGDQERTPVVEGPCTGTGLQSEGFAQVRQTVEGGPLFQAVAANTSLRSCQASGDEKVTIDYQFANGASLRATRDARIEYFDQEVQFASPPASDPIDILTRTERAVFASDGCGIDWKKGEKQPTGESSGTEMVYRGDTCNCQARVRSDASGRPLTLTFRSAC